MMTLTLRKAQNQYRAQLKRLQREKDPTAGSSLIINKRAQGVCYYERRNGKRRGITKNKERVCALARSRYKKALQEVLQSEYDMSLHILSSIERSAKREALRQLCAHYKSSGIDMLRVLRSRSQLVDVGKQSQNPYRPEELKYTTGHGIRTRSKSERGLCNELEEYYVPYQYERKVKVDMTGMENVKGVFYEEGKPWKYYYPDITIFLADGSLLFIEHLGRTDLENYRVTNGEKIIVFLKSRTIDQDHLIVTFEEDLESQEAIRKFIEEKILPLV